MKKGTSHILLTVTQIGQFSRWLGFSCTVPVALEDISPKDPFCVGKIYQSQKGHHKECEEDRHDLKLLLSV